MSNHVISDLYCFTYGSSVSQLEVFILELGTIDGLSTSTISISEITTLNHKVVNDTMESRTLITETLFASCQLFEVFSSLRNGLTVQTNNNTTKIFITLLNVKKDYLKALVQEERVFKIKKLFTLVSDKRTNSGRDIVESCKCKKHSNNKGCNTETRHYCFL